MMPQNLFSKKILILHANAGAGHRKAAEAIYTSLKNRGCRQVVCVDALEYTHPFFRVAYTKGYEYLVGKLPKLWAVFFALTDQKWIQPLFQGLRRIYNGLNTARLVKYIQQEQFDVIVTTHFLSNEVCAYMRRSGMLKGKLVTMVTDYDVHKIWLSVGVDEYCVATPFTKQRLMDMGVPEQKIFVTGIAVDEKFSQPRVLKDMRRKLNIDEHLFTVLISTSSFGFGPIAELAEKLKDQQLLIISGFNQYLKEKLLAQKNPKHRIYGFVDNMEELMSACDVMLTKPGGLSISEALVQGLPLIFFSAIPGQEAGNVKVLAQHGVGVSDKNLDEIVQILKEYEHQPEKLQQAKQASLTLGKPQAVLNIINRLMV